MKQIYLDNSSTSFPKAPGLGKAMGAHIDGNGYNISRGGYGKAYALEREVMEAREELCGFFGAKQPQNVIFTPGATWGLNMVIKGILKPGDHVITTAMEHNAVVRPLTQMAAAGVAWEKIPSDEIGALQVDTLKRMIRPETKLVLIIHGSNVCGTVNSLAEVGALCEKQGVFFAVDASQTAGSVPIDMGGCGIDALVFPAHKGLMGPAGIGGLLLSADFAESCVPLVSGGTGSFSHEERMPEIMPDKFQPGTLNLPGIIGLKHALSFIRQEGIEAIAAKKQELAALFLEEVQNMKGVRVAGLPGTASEGTPGGASETRPAETLERTPDGRLAGTLERTPDGRPAGTPEGTLGIAYAGISGKRPPETPEITLGTKKRCAVVSLDFLELDNGEAGYLLEHEFGIMTRCGLHCAPDAHKTLGTFPQGTVRFSFGYFNTREEIRQAADAVHSILCGAL